MALASGNKPVVEYLLSREDASVVPRGDFASFEQEFEDPPHMAEFADALLAFETKPLMICIAKKDWASLNGIWRRVNCWDTPDFLAVVETLVKLNETEGLRQFLWPCSHFTTLYADKTALQSIVEENPEASEEIRSQIAALIDELE